MAMLRTGPRGAKKVGNLLSFNWGLRGSEMVPWYKKSDLTDRVVRATGLFPSQKTPEY